MEPHLGRRDMFSPTLLSLLQTGCFLSAADYVNAQRMRQVIVGEFHQIFEQVDCLLAPTTPTPAPRIGQNMVSFGDETEDTRLATTRLVRTANLTGFPALSLPCGFSSEGLPIGLEVTCRPFEEALLLRIGAALEDATEFHKRTPALV
jgi:aspartyl-tRNA(Asn)/glutamyl-tRNA(Gln) amidotransferase subunit A